MGSQPRFGFKPPDLAGALLTVFPFPFVPDFCRRNRGNRSSLRFARACASRALFKHSPTPPNTNTDTPTTLYTTLLS
jgi:hypothetical protein